ncbi:hypothetical protein [Paenibacillus sp. IITD108]|uniref:hypothetical protein n=1 Tax=Paenibacillus sp. IITD108 TaxID=3116649 RepID=UPI002F40CF18
MEKAVDRSTESAKVRPSGQVVVEWHHALCFRSSTSRFVATFRAEQESDCLLEQFAWVSLAFPVSPGLAASAAGTCRFGGMVAAKP